MPVRKIAAIICAAGSSSRMGGVKKEYLPLGEMQEGMPLTVLGAAVSSFASCSRVGTIVITVPPLEAGESAARASLPERLLCACAPARIFFVSGGPSRRASVHRALSFLESSAPSHVLIHDGARPWIEPELIERVIDAAMEYGAVIPVLPLPETPKELAILPGSVAAEGSGPGKPLFIKRHLKRAELCTAQTPQGFGFPDILRAHEKAGEREERQNVEYTDDAEVWGEFIGQVAVIPGDPANRKITYPGDINAG